MSKNAIALTIGLAGVAVEIFIAFSDIIYPYHIVWEGGKLVLYKGDME